jgi:ferredoxin
LYNELGDKMEKVKVNQNICIGCGACFGSYPECFEMDDNGLAKEKENLTEEQLEEAKEAIDLCPVGAIQEESEENE